MVLHHGGPTAHSASVLIMLAEKGLDHASRRIDLAGFAQHDADFLALNPTGQVPVLEADGQALTETFFILLYLEECHSDPSLGGADPRARYVAQKWGKYVETHLAPNLAIIGWALSGAHPDTRAQASFARLTPERRLLWEQASAGFSDADVASARAAIVHAIERVAEDLGDGPWVAGADYGVADIAVFPHIVGASNLGFFMPPPVAAWIDRVAARPAVREALAVAVSHIATMGPERGRWG
jgi:glutathione S-transferase